LVEKNIKKAKEEVMSSSLSAHTHKKRVSPGC